MTDTAIARTQTGYLEKPSFIKEGDVRGTENIGRGDIKPPALRLAQSMSPEVKRSEPKYIEKLREGEFFNSITKTIYGEGPLDLVFVNYLGHRNIEFDPADRNTVIDGDVPDGDQRTQFTFKEEGGKKVRVRPRATKFSDFLVLVYPDGSGQSQLMTLSLKSTQLKKAIELNTIFKMSKLPSFAHLIRATVVNEHKGANTWYGWKFTPVGYVSEEQYNEGSKCYDDLVGKKVELDAEGDAAEAARPDDIPF